MVTVIGFEKRKNSEGKEFNVLQLQGEVEMIRAVDTGKFYAHAKRASITSTLNDATCKGLIGKKFPGVIEKVECEPYQYTVPGTEEIITLKHSYHYNAQPSDVEENVFEEA
jgi:hypothetical protein